MDKNGGDGRSGPATFWRIATAIYIRAMHFHRRIDNASVKLSGRVGAWLQSEIKSIRLLIRDETRRNGIKFTR